MYAEQRRLYNAVMPMREKKYRLQQLRLQYYARLQAIRLAQSAPKRITKQALLIGINYIGTSDALYGCINDVNSLKTRVELMGFQCQTLTDTTSVKPTRVNILEAFKRLLVNAVAGDQLFFSYSGHGTNIEDRNKDEVDGMDEALVSSDMKCIVDDELKSMLRYLKRGVTLVTLFDSCHSGTVLDLKYQYIDSLSDADKIYPNNIETAGRVFMISGCMDSQTSADAWIDNKPQGAMTWALVESLKTVQSTWRQLIQTMRALLKEKGYTQIPQFASGTLEDIDTQVLI